MSFMESLENKASRTRTLNGAAAYSTSGEACLDFFAVAGGMRYRPLREQLRLFDRAYIETPDLAMKLLFHIRDIRGGMGERKLFRNLLRHVAFTWPESARKNAAYISRYGRWDDLLCLLGTPAQEEVVRLIREQLERDMQAVDRLEKGEKGVTVSLLPKWMPSGNTSSRRTCKQAARLMQALDMTAKDYRRMLSRLRAHSGLTECRLTARHPERIRYQMVPAGAMLKYRNAFHRQDGKRFSAYLADVAENRCTMHADTLFPHEILRPFFGEGGWGATIRKPKGAETLEMLWKSMSLETGNANALSVVDTSGSTYCASEGVPVPALISQAMGLYCAERCKGLFHNWIITFESNPHLVKIHGKTLEDKLRYLGTLPWGFSTDLEAVFRLILEAAVEADAKQEEMPSVLYIFSDMEFNCAVRNPDKTVYENARELFEYYGYQMPAVVFHNVNSWQMQLPVRANTRGAALTSGAGVSALKEHFDGNVTPMSHMLRVLNGSRYADIRA